MITNRPDECQTEVFLVRINQTTLNLVNRIHHIINVTFYLVQISVNNSLQSCQIV